jgi:hypothetical protein
MNGRTTKKCGLSFKGCSRIPMHQIHLHGKMIHYGTKIAYIYVRTVGRLVVVIDVNPSHGFWTTRLMKLFGHEGK